MTLAGVERTLLAATLAWAGAWAVRGSRPRWRWTQHLGLALVLYPLVRAAVGAALAAPLVVRPTVARALTRPELWGAALDPIRDDLLVPLAGLLLVTRNVPGLHRPPGEARRALASAWEAAALGPWDRTRDGALAGLALFGPLAAAFLAALALRGTVLGQTLLTGDESRVFAHVTVPLALALSVGPALGEEFLFRGLLLSGLTRVARLPVALGLQAVFFGAIHAGYGTLAHVVAPAAFGLALGWVALRVGLGAAVVLHAEANLLFFASEMAAEPLQAALLVVPVGLLSLAALARVGLAPLRELLQAGGPRVVGFRRDRRRPGT